jgi:hypothetical protein
MPPLRFALVLFSIAYAAAQQPAAHVRLGTVGNQTQFHIGQPIPITLDFETDGPQNLLVDTDARLRHLKPQGRDVFSATPEDGWVDPLEDLPWTMDSAMPGPGFPSANLDSLHPVHIERDLNEFIVFRKAGHYLIYVVSNRVARQSLRSNNIALDILPRDNAWTAQEFEAAKATLETGKPHKQPERVFYSDKENAQIDAVRRLRYLETQAATEYLASIYARGRRTDREIEFALYSSPYPDVAVKRLEQQMADPELAVTQSYLTTLFEVKARAVVRQSGHPLSEAERTALTESLNREAFESAANKSPQAKADTYYFLFETGSRSLRGSPEVRQRLIESLPFASNYTLDTLLTTFWDGIKSAGPALVPILKQAASRPSPPFTPSVSGIALLRLSELDQAAANEIAFKDLLSGQLLEADPQLLEFSFPPSSELDEAFLSQYRQGKQVDARIARFASAGFEKEFWRAYQTKLASQPEGSSTCVAPLFAYFFRVDPPAAERSLSEMRKAQPRACTALQFYRLERQLMSPGLEHQLIVDARSADQKVRQAAFQMLSVAGSPAALPALLEALESASGPKGDLLLAILNGRNWFITEQNFAELKRQCVATQFCGEVERVERDSRPPYTLQMSDFNGRQGFWLANREVDSLQELENQISQLTPGASFRWVARSNPVKPDELKRRDLVRALLTKHGMILQNQ